MAIKFSVDRQEQYSIIMLDEEKLNSLNAPELKSEMVVLNNEGANNIILNLSNVSFVDSSGLSAILIGNRLCTNDNGSFVLTNVQENVLKLTVTLTFITPYSEISFAVIGSSVNS